MDFRRARKEAGWTLAHLAAISGYAVGTISDFERTGEGSPHLQAKLTEIFSGKPKSSLMLLETKAIEQGLTDTLSRQQLVEFKEKVRREIAVIEASLAKLNKLVEPTRYKLKFPTPKESDAPQDPD